MRRKSVGPADNRSFPIPAIINGRPSASVLNAKAHARRSETQRQRRKQVFHRGRLKPTDTVWLEQHPLIIGQVALLIGSSDKQDIETSARLPLGEVSIL